MSLRKRKRSLLWPTVQAPNRAGSEASRPGFVREPAQSAAPAARSVDRRAGSHRRQGGAGRHHVLSDLVANARLYEYETRIKDRFDSIEPVLRDLARLQSQSDFVAQAQALVRQKLGVALPERLLGDSWIGGLDIRRLYGHCLFEVYRSFAEEFYERNPLASSEDDRFVERLRGWGYHAVGVAPCADGRLAHVVSYVLRLPWSQVRRKAHAGVLFDVSESVRNWVFVEHNRYRTGLPVPADEPTRYLKIAVYHFSSSDPQHQGCAAHGSDDVAAATAARDRLDDFVEAIENRFCCGATVDTLLVGLNTDDDSMRVHFESPQGGIDLDLFIDTGFLFDLTLGMDEDTARHTIRQQLLSVATSNGGKAPAGGKLELVEWLIVNNLSQVDYVRSYHDGRYADIGHAERFIGVGAGFGEVQLRNLTYYAFLDTLEEGVADVDVGVKIFSGLNVRRGLPIPVVVRGDFDGRVPGSRDRAQTRVRRIESAMHARYADLSRDGLFVTRCTLKDVSADKAPIMLDEPDSGNLGAH
ncbi:MAG: carboxysome shell carbonic anhydrase [Halothiobacillaceae bacterium]